MLQVLWSMAHNLDTNIRESRVTTEMKHNAMATGTARQEQARISELRKQKENQLTRYTTEHHIHSSDSLSIVQPLEGTRIKKSEIKSRQHAEQCTQYARTARSNQALSMKMLLNRSLKAPSNVQQAVIKGAMIPRRRA